ncbi:MAG TPA: MerR family transcriptional regulator, partial [Rhodospirillales bacterium]|nr:MerR family transcriptional regulator [Rhodospirillales bacterium]
MTGDMTEKGDNPAATGRGRKSASAFRTISEVAAELDLPQHVLRFWETKFSVIRPMKRGGGRRYYRPEDITLLRRIGGLLYTDGYTIKGVQKLLREGGGK